MSKYQKPKITQRNFSQPIQRTITTRQTQQPQQTQQNETTQQNQPNKSNEELFKRTQSPKM